MNAATNNNTVLPDPVATAQGEVARVLDLNSADARNQPTGSQQPPINRIANFVVELRRRQVCRTITMYTVALWLACQVVDVLSPHLALPEWTLKLVIVLGLIGFPIAIVLSWLFDITRDGGVVREIGARSGLAKSGREVASIRSSTAVYSW